MRVLVLSLLLASGCVAASNVFGANVELYDRATGQVLPTYRYHGRTYVAGEPGHEYEIRIRNRSGGRVLAVTTVDGVNVITGQTGATSQAGYVLDAHDFTRIEGWRKSMTHTAAFYFTKLPDSYAARTGRPDNVGVIGVAFFRERVRCCEHRGELQSSKDVAREDAAGAPSAAAPSPALSDRAAKRSESKLGTGHGRIENSQAQYTEFERASKRPDETIVIYYDSRRNLLAQGVIPSPQRHADRLPVAFPAGFVPDP